MLYKIGKKAFDIIPFLRPILLKGQHRFAPKFDGWGMTSVHELPNTSESEKRFNDALNYVHQNFDKSNSHSYDKQTIDVSLWRFWFASYAARHAKTFADSDIFVECGVGMGYTAYFAMTQLESFTMHLYDRWGGMPERDNFYEDLDIETTKKNLVQFEKNIVYHKGTIPETFVNAPDKIAYIHIDLNSAQATKETLEFFIPRLVDNAVILFDEYGFKGESETKEVTDDILSKLKGIFLKLPTGQAIYYHKLVS